MTTRRCNICMLYYPDMVWSHTVSNCPFCGASIKDSGKFEHMTPEEKQAYREINEGKEKIEKTVSDASDSKNPNIIELDTVSEANKVDLSVYRWSERMSAKEGKYIFVLRQIKRDK